MYVKALFQKILLKLVLFSSTNRKATISIWSAAHNKEVSDIDSMNTEMPPRSAVQERDTLTEASIFLIEPRLKIQLLNIAKHSRQSAEFMTFLLPTVVLFKWAAHACRASYCRWADEWIFRTTQRVHRKNTKPHQYFKLNVDCIKFHLEGANKENQKNEGQTHFKTTPPQQLKPLTQR